MNFLRYNSSQDQIRSKILILKFCSSKACLSFLQRCFYLWNLIIIQDRHFMAIALFLNIFIILTELVKMSAKITETVFHFLYIPTYNNDQEWMNKMKLIHTFWTFFIAFLLVQIYMLSCMLCLSIICVTYIMCILITVIFHRKPI